MADLEKIVKLIFEGDGTGLSREMKTVSRDFDNFSQNVQDATRPLMDFGMGVAKAEAALIVLAAGGMVLSIKAADEFKTQIAEVGTLINDTAFDINTFENDVKDYAATSVKSMDDINGAIYAAVSAGIDYKDVLSALSTAEQLSVAGKADLKDSLLAIVSPLNSYGLGMESAAEFADILFTTVQKGQTTLPELASDLSKVTPIAANVGVSFGDLNAAIAAVTAGGTTTSEAMTGVRAALLNILKPSKEAQDESERLGIEFNSTAVQSKGLAGFLDDVQAATGGNVDSMTKLFGSAKGLTTVLALTGLQSEKFKEALEAMKSSTDAVQVAFEKMSGDISLKLQNLYNNANLFMINAGSKIVDGASETVSAFTGIFAGLNQAVNTGTFDAIFDAINEFFGDTKGLLDTIAKNLPEALAGIKFDGFISSFQKLGQTVGNALDVIFGGDLDLSSVSGLETAIQRVIDIITGMTNFTAGFISGWEPVLTVIGDLATRFSEMGEEGQDLAGKIAGWAGSVNTLFSALDSFKSVLWAIAGITGLNQVFTFITNLGAAKNAASIGVLGQSITTLGLSFKTLLGAFSGLLLAWEGGQAFGRFINSFEGVQNAVQGVIGRVDQIFNFSGNADAVKWAESGRNAGTSLRDGIQEGIEGAPLDPEPLLIDWAEELKDQDWFKNVTVPLAVEPEVTSGPAMWTWVDDDGTVHFSDSEVPGSSRIDLDVAPTLDEAAAKDTVDKTKTFIEEIKAQAETIQAAIEWKAKLDIAEVEANAKIMTAAFDAAASSFGSAADAAASMVDALGGVDMFGDYHKYNDIKRFIEDQIELQSAALQIQKDLADSQIRLNELRSDALESGDGSAKLNITVDDSVTPAVKLVLFEVLNLLQIEMNEYADQYLLGVT